MVLDLDFSSSLLSTPGLTNLSLLYFYFLGEL